MQMFSAFLHYIQRYEEVTATTKAVITNTKYGANTGTLLTFTLPTTSSVGDKISIVGIGAGGWKIAQNASQLIRIGTGVSTTGATGYIASSNQYDCIDLTCTVANTTWTATSVLGSITVV